MGKTTLAETLDRYLLGPADRAKVLTLIQKCRLQHLAGFPAVLDYLKTKDATAEIGEAEVWKGLLATLLD